MARLPFGEWSATQAVGSVDLRRGTPRMPRDASNYKARLGDHRDKHALCMSELGIGFIAVHVLAVLVARKRDGIHVTTRGTVETFLRREEGFGVSDAFTELTRARLVRDLGKDGAAAQWVVTDLGERKLLGWAGMLERETEAAEWRGREGLGRAFLMPTLNQRQAVPVVRIFHALRGGLVLCGGVARTPSGDWLPGHSWCSWKYPDLVTCPGCRAVLAGEGKR